MNDLRLDSRSQNFINYYKDKNQNVMRTSQKFFYEIDILNRSILHIKYNTMNPWHKIIVVAVVEQYFSRITISSECKNQIKRHLTRSSWESARIWKLVEIYIGLQTRLTVIVQIFLLTGSQIMLQRTWCQVGSGLWFIASVIFSNFQNSASLIGS